MCPRIVWSALLLFLMQLQESEFYDSIHWFFFLNCFSQFCFCTAKFWFLMGSEATLVHQVMPSRWSWRNGWQPSAWQRCRRQARPVEVKMSQNSAYPALGDLKNVDELRLVVIVHSLIQIGGFEHCWFSSSKWGWCTIWPPYLFPLVLIYTPTWNDMN